MPPHNSRGKPPSKLRDRRIAVGLTAGQLGRAAGLSENSIYAYEGGHITPSAQSAEKVARALGCDVADVFDRIAKRNRHIEVVPGWPVGATTCQYAGCDEPATAALCPAHTDVAQGWPLLPLEPTDDPEWQTRAACRDMDPELFFPEVGPEGRVSQLPPFEVFRACRRCPVRGDCLKSAMSEVETAGFWGGTSEKDRRQPRRRREGAA